MSRALVIHPHLSLWAGGEYISLLACKTLLDNGYDVSLACESYDLDRAERIWGMADVMSRCQWVPLPRTIPRLSSVQRAMFLPMVKKRFEKLRPDITFNTQLSSYMMDGISLAYHHGDLQYLYGQGTSSRAIYYAAVRGMMNHV